MNYRMKIADIKIPKHYNRRRPRQGKVDSCREYYKKHGVIDRDIVVNKNGVIKDGYIGYLVLQENSVDEIEVKEETRKLYMNEPTMYVHAHHFGKKKMYTWRITNKTKNADLIHIGGKAIVNTKNGRKLVIIDGFEVLNSPPVKYAVKKVCICFEN